MRVLVLTALMLSLASTLAAQPPPPVVSVPESWTLIVIGPTGDPLTAPALASRSQLRADVVCNQPPIPDPPLPLINPTKATIEDPFLPPSNNRVCILLMPANIPAGTNLRAVATATGTCNNDATTPPQPCTSPRSVVGIPSFNSVPLIHSLPPAAPTALRVKP